MSLPVGFGFEPNNKEIILVYLYNKIIGKPLPSDNSVIECDLYGNEEQWRNIFEQTGEKPLHFFTKIENGSPVERRTGYGTWKSRKDKKIYYDEKKTKHIGSLQKFIFIQEKGSKVEGIWVMHEYRLDGCLNKIKHNDYILCKIKKEEEEEEDE